MKKILFILITVLLMTQTVGFADVMVQNGKVRLTVQPGETIVDTMKVFNTIDKPLQIRAYWQDFNYTEPYDGRKEFLPAGASDYSCSDWINFKPKRFRLPPFGSMEIDYSINVPEDAKGGYHGVLFFETGADTVEAQTGLSIVTRIGSLFFLETANRDKTAKAGNFTVIKDGIQGTFSNQGDVILIPKGTFYLLDEEGIVAERGEVKTVYLPPNKQQNFEVVFPGDLKSGQYMCVLTFDLEDGFSIVREIDLTKDAKSNFKIVDVRE